MQACLQRCCHKKSCDVVLLIDGRCYGVACFSEELCKPVPVPHPHFVFSQIGFLNKGQKRGDIERTQGRVLIASLPWAPCIRMRFLYFLKWLIRKEILLVIAA